MRHDEGRPEATRADRVTAGEVVKAGVLGNAPALTHRPGRRLSEASA